jgi:hypothetical protein
MLKDINYFESELELQILTEGCKYLSISGNDIALTKNQNIFIKVYNEDHKLTEEVAKNRIDYIIKYLIDEDFVPKSKKNKKIYVWVYVQY